MARSRMDTTLGDPDYDHHLSLEFCLMRRLRFRIRTLLVVVAFATTIFALVESEFLLNSDKRILAGLYEHEIAEIEYLTAAEHSGFFSMSRNRVVAICRVCDPDWFPGRPEWLRRKLFTRVQTVCVHGTNLNGPVLDTLSQLPQLRVIEISRRPLDLSALDESVARFLEANPRALIRGGKSEWRGERFGL